MANPMLRYEIFIGVWNTRGNVLAVGDDPATLLTATDVYRWGPGRRFILHDVDARFGDQVARSMEVVGFEGKRYVARSYDDQGVSETFRVALTRRRWTISGAAVRFDGAFDRAGNTLTGLWERKAKRGRWQPWIELELARA